MSNDPDVQKLLHVCCFNVRGLIHNSTYLKDLLRNVDIIAISEHWLHDYNLNSFNSLHCDFKLLATAPPREEDPVFCVPRLIRGHGGVALGWRTLLDHLISPVPSICSAC